MKHHTEDSFFVPEREVNIGNLEECGNLTKLADCCFAIPAGLSIAALRNSSHKPKTYTASEGKGDLPACFANVASASFSSALGYLWELPLTL